MSHFILKSKTKLSDLELGAKISESDFALAMDHGGEFYQFEYVETEESKKEPFMVKPGVWSVINSVSGLTLEKTSFVNDRVLDQFVETKSIEDKVDCFFKKLDVYKKLGIEVPKRAALLYGNAGTGKSTIINKICDKYNRLGDTAVIIWPTSIIEPYELKEFIKVFQYQNVNKLILVAEDIGGIEMENTRVRSDPALLALLDNKEKSFSIPTFILATTNYPAMFLENLGNRPDRFDDKIEVGFPNKTARLELLKFFSLEPITEECFNFIQTTACEKFSPAHLREVVIRSMLFDKPMIDVLKEMVKEIKAYQDGFEKKHRNGMAMGVFDD